MLRWSEKWKVWIRQKSKGESHWKQRICRCNTEEEIAKKQQKQEIDRILKAKHLWDKVRGLYRLGALN